jgi:acyl-coenzyme A synthetase/AMP-(fatty) acid ligase
LKNKGSSGVMISKLDWVEFWYNVLLSDDPPSISQDTITMYGPDIWRSAESRASEFVEAGAQAGEVVFTTQTGWRLVIDTLAAAKADLIIAPISSIQLNLHISTDQSGVRGWLATKEKFKSVKFHKSYLKAVDKSTSVIVFTSGFSTGYRRPIGLTTAGIKSQLISHSEYFSDEWGRSRLAFVDSAHSFGLILNLWLGLFQRQKITILNKPFTSIRFLQKILYEREIEIIATTPRLAHILIKKLENKFLNKLHLHIGTVSGNTGDIGSAFNPCRNLTLNYGLTECGPGVLQNGYPVGCEVQVRSKSSEKQGDIWVRSLAGAPQNKVDKDGYFFTNDIGILNQDGSIRVLGRSGRVEPRRNKAECDSEWHTIERFKEELKDLFGCVVSEIANEDQTIVVEVLSETPKKWEVQKYLYQRYGIPVIVFEKVVGSKELELKD